MKAGALLIAGGVIAADRLAKWLVERSLELHESLELVGPTLRLTHVRNSGVVFGLMNRPEHPLHGWPIAALSAAVLAAILVYLWKAPAGKRLLHLSLGLVIGGAVGNLWDRVRQGFVTDFVDVHLGFIGVNAHWPAFNVADAAICVGVGLMALEAWRSDEGRVTERRARTT